MTRVLPFPLLSDCLYSHCQVELDTRFASARICVDENRLGGALSSPWLETPSPFHSKGAEGLVVRACRIYIMSSSTGGRSLANTATTDSEMRKKITRSTRREAPNKIAKKNSASSHHGPSSLAGLHPYLGEQKVNDIESWTAGISTKPTQHHGLPDDIDPVVQAYLQAKMALFQSLVASSAGSDSQSSKK